MTVNVKRFPQNPLIRPADLQPSRPSLEVACVLNPGAFRYQNRIGLVLRVSERPLPQPGKLVTSIFNMQTREMEDFVVSLDDPKLGEHSSAVGFVYDGKTYLGTMSHLLVAWSDDGGQTFKPDYNLRIWPEHYLESYGLEDCRVEQIEGTYYLTYTAASPSGATVAMITTTDWKNFSRHEVILPPRNKDCALFPRKINGLYYMLHRPIVDYNGNAHIWMADSPDMRHWGNHRLLARNRIGKFDAGRLGAGAAPFETPEGWLELYHGATNGRYCLGLLLLDKNEPWKILARSEEPVMIPEMEYELHGFVNECVFVNGQIIDGDKLTIFYGASDSVVCGAELSVKELLATLH